MSEDWLGPGVRAEGSGSSDSGPSSRRKPKKETLYDCWKRHLIPACFGKATIFTESVPAFNTNMKRLREQGVTDEQLRRYFEVFAEGIKAGHYAVEGKSALRVFLRVWPKLARSAGSSIDPHSLSEEDFLL